MAIKAQDSLQYVHDIVNTGVAVLDATHNTIIPGVSNNVTGPLITAIVLGIIRFFEKRKLKKRLSK